MWNFSKKLTALAFIALILLGNIWLLAMFTGGAPPGWTAYGFFVCIGVVAIGALGMLVGYFLGSSLEQD